MKDKVYSWRLDAELKAALKEAARNNDTTISNLLEGIVTRWLHDQSVRENDSGVQQQLHRAARECAGSIKGGQPKRAANALAIVRERLKQKNAS